MVVRAFVQPVVIMALAAALLMPGAGVASAQAPIGPDQHFIGLVNGSNTSVTVDTVCPGPIWKGREGPLAGGQTMSVGQVARRHGYTGPFSQIYAWFVPRHHETPIQLVFSEYGVPRWIPSSVRVPCDGPGRVEFSSCPYLAPCAFGWIPNEVRVTFVNIAD